ncbi:flavin reductase family protein [Methylomonas methanica]|uniref:Flavin reductase domain protein FMN-binding protein n=1 Tax=Methylomonas methanica (strain DSM 25384 / MC09) TaxID=857087 RepID=G0A5E5_METMM|nr:flavin reductase family protein [Methylomonas methanica]AEG01651.1 flavin reductase domain protein FMN-binding protein [Methylomonas methanica MC09]
MSVDASQFKNALKLWASGVTVVTAQSEQQGLKGMTATSFSSVSVDPPQILVCLNQNTDTGAVVLEQKRFAVNILGTEQQNVSNQFAGGATQEERFAGVAWEAGENGAPLLTDALASLECKVVDQVLAGTHWIVIGEVQKVVCRGGDPLLYYSGAYRQLSGD